MLLGDCIELAPEPGESHSRVAQVQALWSECLADGQERKLARCRRFYRPEVCSAPLSLRQTLLQLPSHVLNLRGCVTSFRRTIETDSLEWKTVSGVPFK